MPRHVAVVFVHGIFAEGFSYAEPMRKALLQVLPRELQQYVRFESVFWAHEVRGHQRNFMQNVRSQADVVDNRLRRFLIEGLGDAAAYQKTKHRENSMYYDVHASIGHVLDRIDSPGRARAADDLHRALARLSHHLVVCVGHQQAQAAHRRKH